MRNERGILLNTAVLGLCEGGGQLANFVLVITFARVFGTATLAHYSVAMAVGAVAALFVGCGTQSLLIREISRDRSHAPVALGVLLPFQSILALIAWISACAITVAVTHDIHALPLIMAVCGYQVLLALSGLLMVPLRAKELMHWYALPTLAHRILILGIGLAVIYLGGSAVGVGLAQIVGALALVGFAAVHVSRRFGRPTFRFAPSEALALFRRASPFFGIEALSILYGRVALIVLSVLVVSHSVGLYAAADRFMVAPALASTMFNAAVYPALARISSTASMREAQALTARCVRMLLVLTFPIAILVTVFAQDIIVLCFGPAYLESARVLQVLVWSLPIRGAQGLLASQLAVMDRQAGIARARAIGTGALFVCVPLFIWLFGFVGAAWALLVCDALQFTLHCALLRSRQAQPPLARAVLVPAAAAALTAVASVVLRGLQPALYLMLVVLVLVAGMFGVGAIRLHDLRFLRALLARKSG